MSKARTTLFPNGVSNASPNTFAALANLRIGDPTKYHVLFEDFDEFDTTFDWVDTSATGSAALTDADGGEIVLTTTAVNNDFVSVQRIGESFL